jgi:hypothetical protein
MIARYVEKWEMRIKSWEFDRNEFDIKKRTPDNRALNSKTRSKQRKYYNW